MLPSLANAGGYLAMLLPAVVLVIFFGKVTS
ncbi:MAG: hypothetical protein UT48_C0008G0016 [Parcubacteria group bacterium GW2011_GWE2_39_37]|uniref:Uncharacterized protein n=1 Tax=Candidatus Falkowbacteria bacterium GW2011_GWF2_39_8 TaxID=1618642 RepID=A0A0G0T0J9_9BACT|nr:MAG: hypothetical protein UT48_C0008G0016 [Parcubacteria group bacterium GW2011_GWE2_39_37]KKR31372.1 MAG: hypothetical protein UT64_C0062G0003 [Candidatus Falkowbacteria bacterium GW2011_GWF2_39_8]